MGIRVALLGPVRGWAAERELELGAPMQRALFGLLAVNANRMVPRSELIFSLWGEQAPASAEGSVHTYVAGLRRTLEPNRTQRAPSTVLISTGAGYLLRMNEELLDVTAFAAHRERARSLRAEGRQTEAVAELDRAVALWQGTPFDGLACPYVDSERARLSELRLQVVDERAELMLALGRHHDLAAELPGVVREHPLGERLRWLLMLTLYRCGRQADALEVYQDVRRVLAEDLGVEPSAELRQLHAQILRNDPGLAAPRAVGGQLTAGAVVPAQLPHDVPGFTGREAELTQLTELLDEAGRGVLITAVDGSGGIGKTALAVHFAHRVSPRFPEGQLYVNLRGFDPRLPPLMPTDALGYLLRGLGVPPRQVPADLDDQVGMYRSLVAGRRILVVLDNAATTDQVRPLLPGDGSCAVIVTSRNRLSGLVARDGARRITLDLLSTEESLRLMAAMLGPGRVNAEPDAAEQLVRLCGYLPLALRIAGDRAATHPHLLLADLAAELSDERDRLDVLAPEDDESTAVRAVFSWSYHALKPETARVFRMLGLHVGPEISTPAAAALAGLSVPTTRRLLTDLTDRHLLDEVDRDRYRLHDLLRVYAAEEVLHGEDARDRDAAVDRMMDFYLYTADNADNALRGQDCDMPVGNPPPECRPLTFDGYLAALQWFDVDGVNLFALDRLAAQTWRDLTVWRFGVVLWEYMRLRRDWERIIEVSEYSMAAARRMGDSVGEALSLSSIGASYVHLGRPQEAMEHVRRMPAVRYGPEDAHREMSTLSNLAEAYRGAQRHDAAVRCYERALVLARQTGSSWHEGDLLRGLGETRLAVGDLAEALACCTPSLEIFRELGDLYAQNVVLQDLGAIQLAMGGHREAARHYADAVTLARRIDHRHAVDQALAGLRTAESLTT
ncbi:DNA-binding SARP family transcriptional activator/tetratricopeptide (TPR) repeat protein [Kutzneria viridogrisea]|uniref:DNA-binding SARP family transcriptional activator/tetratricopeptide (TPR) repeat protein n=1 Tax=Kutzneria viridogrisea TaxID=47990 RepID=A0ABR6BX07_9PSEU|nr:BTAD domain-containing putative transcriptional regulator [Kutzneria albida]MBA8931433.1 DNA-binding SARP family transcriptional activator/tetratricopeptide (TPR) repeat protein [Kutzneria viridogrisea]